MTFTFIIIVKCKSHLLKKNKEELFDSNKNININAEINEKIQKKESIQVNENIQEENEEKQENENLIKYLLY